MAFEAGAAMEALSIARHLAACTTVGGLIDQVLDDLARLMDSPLVSFNEIDLVKKTAAVSLRPYEPAHRVAVDRLDATLEQHPVFVWYQSQADWTPVRLSQVSDRAQLVESQLYKEVLLPVGGQHMMMMLVLPPVEQLVFFVVNRPDHDFSDDELELLRYLQPAVVALYRQFTGKEAAGAGVMSGLTRRELSVLKLLASGVTAEVIAVRLNSSPRTVRKHLQNVYAKLQTHDRLTTILRARDLGLLNEHDLSTEFTWHVRLERRT